MIAYRCKETLLLEHWKHQEGLLIQGYPSAITINCPSIAKLLLHLMFQILKTTCSKWKWFKPYSPLISETLKSVHQSMFQGPSPPTHLSIKPADFLACPQVHGIRNCWELLRFCTLNVSVSLTTSFQSLWAQKDMGASPLKHVQSVNIVITCTVTDILERPNSHL